MKKYLNFKNTVYFLFFAFLISGLFVSAYILYERYYSEKSYNSISTMVDYTDIVRKNSIDFLDALVKYNFRDYINTIILRPEKVKDYVNQGKILTITGIEIKNQLKVQAVLTPYIIEIVKNKGIVDEFTYVYSENKDILLSVNNLIKKDMKDAETEIIEKEFGYRKKQKAFYILLTKYPKELINEFYMGFNKDIISSIKNSDFSIAYDITGISDKDAIELIKREENIPDYIIAESISKELNEYVGLKNIKKIRFEFEKNIIPYKYIRGHILKQHEELENDTIVRRLKRAVIERKIRSLKYEFQPDKDINTNFNNLKKLKILLERVKFNYQNADYFKLGKINKINIYNIIVVIAVVLFIAYALNLLLNIELKDITIYTVFVCIGIFFIMIYKKESIGNLKLFLSFLSSVIIPMSSLSLLRFNHTKDLKKRYINTFSNIFELVSFNLIGAFLCVSLFYNEQYLMGERLFRGVKASFLLPIIGFLIYSYFKERLVFSDIIEKEVKVKHLLSFLIFMFLVLYYIIRSSNFGASYMLPFEKIIRNLLEDIFIVRPRTKEFLILYPALFFISFKLFKSRKSITYYTGLLFIIIGQTSIFNTFMHFHTPLITSIYRTINGLVLGFIMGMILLLIFDSINFAKSLFNIEKGGELHDTDV